MMKIKRSEIWYTYSTIYNGPLIPFDILAGIFLASKITKCVYSSHGKFYYIKNKKIETQNVEAKISVDQSKASFSLRNWPDDDFSKETLYQSLLNNYFENKNFSINSNFIDNNYLRFSLDEFIIQDNTNSFHIYPFINFYNSGVVILEMRIIYDFDINLDDFINKYVNLSLKEFNICYSNKAISDFSIKLNAYKEDVKKIEDDTLDFKFELFEFVLDKNQHKSLTNIALQLFYIVENILNNPLQKKKKLFKYLFDIGKYWIGKPHIHILKYSNQLKYSSDNLKKHEIDIKRILMRISFEKSEFKDDISLVDNRLFEDFNTFFNIAVSLNLWSLYGLEKNKEWEDLNYNSHIYSNQVINRFLDFYYMLHKKSLYVIEETNNYDDILRFQSDYYYMQNDYNQFAKAGELTNLFDRAKQEFNIEKHEEIISNLLEIKRLELESKKNNSFNIMSLLISIIFGIISAGNLSNDVLKPLWKLFNFPLFCNTNLNDLLFWIFSFILILIIIKVIFIKLKGK